MVLRQLSPERGKGAVRTIVEIVPVEDERHVSALSRKYVKRGATVMTDECPAYSRLIARYKHYTVNHTQEFSTPKGISNNQAESFFARMRRLEVGQIHRLAPKYMLEYTMEIAWREDTREMSPSAMVKNLAAKTLKSLSTGWRRYWQGEHRAIEVLFVRARLGTA